MLLDPLTEEQLAFPLRLFHGAAISCARVHSRMEFDILWAFLLKKVSMQCALTDILMSVMIIYNSLIEVFMITTINKLANYF